VKRVKEIEAIESDSFVPQTFRSSKEEYLADLIILDRNPLEIPVEEVKDVQVLETIKEGKIIYQRQEGK